jgi:hypothetical protein
LGRLRISSNGLAQFTGLQVEEEEPSKELKWRLDQFGKFYNELVDLSASAFPFVPPDMHEELEKCMTAAQIHIKRIEAGRFGEADSKIVKHFEYAQFNFAYYKAARLARQRVQKMPLIS